jgi:SAM-dependent methyltransferase
MDRTATRQAEVAPRIVGLALVKNEEDVIEPFVRHNLRFLDVLFVADNGSADRTREILVSLEREGLRVVVIDDPVVAYLQSEKMTRMLRGVSAALLPDFVLALDADEFISCESPTTFREQLGLIPPGAAGLIRWSTYVLSPELVAQEVSDPPRSMTLRRRAERPQYYKVALRLDGRYDPDLALVQGNHSAVGENGAKLPEVTLEGVALAHFPVRSEAQLASKAVVGWMAYLHRDRDARRSDLAYQWRDAFDLVLAKGGVPREELALRSLLYAQDRRPVDWAAELVSEPGDFIYQRRYGGGRREPALATVARSWERAICPPVPYGDELRRLISARIAELRADPAEGGEAVSGTAFPPIWHLEHPYFDVAPFRYVAERFQPRSVLDVGCGMGAALLLFRHLGSERILGLDGFPTRFSLLQEGEYRQRDLTGGFELGETFDLVTCIEVAEHLRPGTEEAFLAALAGHARETILFSAAGVGQPGEGHINCRPMAEWLGWWLALGWTPDPHASLAFRAVSTFSWLRRNPVVLRRVATQPEPPPTRLHAIGQLGVRWPSQAPAIYDHAFGEDPPRDLYLGD